MPDKVHAEVFNLQAKTGANLFTTSRPNLKIQAMFKGCPSCEILAREEDIRRYLHGHMWQLLSFVQESPDLQKQIETEIAVAAKGMYASSQLLTMKLIR